MAATAADKPAAQTEPSSDQTDPRRDRDRPAADIQPADDSRGHRNGLERTELLHQLLQTLTHVLDAACDAIQHIGIAIKRSAVQRGHVVQAFHRRASSLMQVFLIGQHAAG